MSSVNRALNEITFSCLEKFVSLIYFFLFFLLENVTLKEIDNDVSVPSGNNKSQFPSKKTNIGIVLHLKLERPTVRQRFLVWK